jgi:hypothetical protein
MKEIVFVLLFLFIPLINFGWTENPNASIRSKAMGGAGVCLTDAYSLSTNQAGLGFFNTSFVATSFDTRFISSGISNKAFLAGIPINNLGMVGLQFNSYGTKNYSENKVGIAYSKAFGERVSCGLQLNYLNTVIGDIYGKSGTVSAEAGVLVKVTNQLSLGVHLFNPTRAKIASNTLEYAPTVLRLGFLYEFNKKVFITGDVYKSNQSMKPGGGLGIEYIIYNGLYLRTGVSSNPIQNTFGVGYVVGNLKADIYAGFNYRLGYSSGVSLSYSFKKSSVKEITIPKAE